MDLDERAIIETVFRPLAGKGSLDLRDDAALIEIPDGCDLVVTTDMIAEDVHFLPGDPPDTIARKALRVNLSDLAAKGARPLAFTLAAGFATADADWIGAFAAGLAEDCAAYGIALVGGDTIATRGGAVFSVTAMGLVARGGMVHRSGGRAGDALYVSGAVGGSTAGLALLQGRSGAWDSLADEERAALVDRYRVPQPRVALAGALAKFASAAMDVSDGLVGDCDKLAEASACGAEIDAECVPLHPGLAAWRGDAETMAALLAAIPPDREARFRAAALEAETPVERIGRLIPEPRLTRVTLHGKPLAFARRSFVHTPGVSP
jgi:thiamine-monophosphate kinase